MTGENETREENAEMMSDKTLNALIAFLRGKGWTESEIVELFDFISK